MSSSRLINAFLKAVQAKDDTFVLSVVGAESYEDSDIKKMMSGLDKDMAETLFGVLVSILAKDPNREPTLRWIQLLLDSNLIDAESQRNKEAALALDSMLDFRLKKAELESEMAETTSKLLDEAVLGIQVNALKEARDELTKASRTSQPLIRLETLF